MISLGEYVVQSVNDGTVPLVAGKSTMVRVGMATGGLAPAGTLVDGILRVYVDGAEASWSPVYSENGPLDVSLSPSLASIDGTLNFVFLPPQSDNVVLEVEINPAGPTQVQETDTSNNLVNMGQFSFGCRRVAEVVYVPIDYRPSGGPVPNLPDESMIIPGSGDNFIQGVYVAPDWEYHRSDVPSKLWTSSLSGTGSSLNSSLLADLQLMVPKPDFIYGWIPGGLPYNGQAIGIPGQAAMGNTDPVRYQRTFAHELGHLFGLSHNSTKLNQYAVDVEHHSNLPLNLPQVKDVNLNDIMTAGLQSFQAWVAPGNYKYLLNHAVFQCQQPLLYQPNGDSLLVGGVWNRVTESVDLTYTVAFGQGQPTPSVPLERADLVLRAFAGDQLLSEVGIAANSAADACEECRGAADSNWQPSPDSGFAVVLPATVDPAEVTRLVLVNPANGRVVSALEQSRHAPVVEFVSPEPGAMLDSVTRVVWSASDADGDALSYYLRYSPDGEQLVPLASATTDMFLDVDLSALPGYQPGSGYFEVIATDGLRSTSVKTVGPRGGQLFLGSGGNRPWTHILTPDAGKSFPFGATVILHCSGWDLEDRSLSGASLVWTSNVDGVIATGRVASTADLSVGTHTLTVTATDSSGKKKAANTVITIDPRDLPGGSTCQADEGFGGPGRSVLSVCGGDLSAGTTADILLSGAEPNALAALALGGTFAPTPLLGGTLVTVPAAAVIVEATDSSGEWLIPGIQGGGGPMTVWLQAVYLDGAQGDGFGISNAVRVEFLP